MNKFAIALALFGFAVLMATGQQSTATNTSRSNVKNNIQVVTGPDGKVHCTSTPASGKAADCNASQMAQLNKALAGFIDFSKGGKPKNSGVKSITQAKDGSLMCTTASSTSPCTSTHLPDLKQADARVNSELENATPASPAQK